jgi:hypothetical protein
VARHRILRVMRRGRSRRAALAACLAIAAALAQATSGIGGGAVPPADSIDASRDVGVLRGADLEPVPAPRVALPGAGVSRRSAKLSYFTTVNFETVVPGGDQVYEIRCPAKRQPLTGGVLSGSPGLVISNSSRTSPDPDRPTLSGAWYEGVVNLTGTALVWKPVLVCVRS